MSHYQRILLIADPSMQRTPAFERAAWLTKATGAPLHIVIFDRSATIAAVARINAKAAPGAREAWIGQRQRWLAEETMVLRGRGLKVTTEIVWARPTFDEILNYIAACQPDLLIKDVQRELAIRHILLKPLDWQLMRDCATPIMLVNTLAHAESRRVVAAVDVSSGLIEPDDFNERVIKAARRLSSQCDAELHLAYAFNFDINDIKSTVADFSDFDYEHIREMHLRTFSKLTDAQKIPAMRAHFLYGPPASALAEFTAIEKPDVLVVGTHQRQGLDHLMLGSAAESILDAANCDLLVIKPG